MFLLFLTTVFANLYVHGTLLDTLAKDKIRYCRIDLRTDELCSGIYLMTQRTLHRASVLPFPYCPCTGVDKPCCRV